MNAPHETDHQRLALEILQEIPVLYGKIEAACDVRREQVPMLLTEVVRYLNLVAVSDEILTPSKVVDKVWHEFILFTASYGKFCIENFGCMIHHFPGGSDERIRGQFQLTLEIYRSHFGAPDPVFWSRSEYPNFPNCGGCEAGT